MEAITENLMHLWVEKQCYQQFPCPLQCNNNVLVLLVFCSCSLLQPRSELSYSVWCKSNKLKWYWFCVLSLKCVIFSFRYNWGGGNKAFPSPFKYFWRVWHWPPSLLPWVLIPKYRVWCSSVFCCCSEITQHYAACLSRWRKICTDLYMANTFSLMLLYYVVYRLAGGKTPVSGCLPSVPYRSENMWGSPTGAPVNM